MSSCNWYDHFLTGYLPTICLALCVIGVYISGNLSVRIQCGSFLLGSCYIDVFDVYIHYIVEHHKKAICLLKPLLLYMLAIIDNLVSNEFIVSSYLNSHHKSLSNDYFTLYSSEPLLG